jgi:hypothetical protein
LPSRSITKQIRALPVAPRAIAARGYGDAC